MADQLAVQMTQSGVKSEFMAHAVPPTQSSIESTRVVEYSPVSALNDKPGSLIEFSVPPSAEEFIDLDETYIQVKMSYSAKTTSGTTVTDTPQANISPTNNLLHCLFSKVELTVGHHCVNPNSIYYPYRAYIETLLGYSREAKETFLSAAGWMSQSDEDLTKVNAERGKKWGIKKEFTLYGKLFLDLSGQDKLLLNATPLRLTLQVNKPEFAFLCDVADTKVTFSLKDVKLHVLKKKATAAQMDITKRMLEKASAKYSVRRIEVRNHLVTTGTSSVSLDNVFSGTLPSRMIIGLVQNDALTGTLAKNPFNFEHFDLNHASVIVNGDEVPRVPYRPDFAADIYQREFFELFHGISKLHPHPKCYLTEAMYKSGHTLLCFNLTADGSDISHGHFNPLRRGTARVDLKFAKPLPSVTSVIVFAEFDGIITIDKDRNVETLF